MKKLSIILALSLFAFAANAQVFGDLNKDRAISVSDISSLAIGLLDNIDEFPYDINSDGQCDVKDITALAKCILDGTLPERPVQFVDLGLSVKWATYNIGATSEAGAGSFFAWGETSSKDEFTESNSLTYSKNMSKLITEGVISADGKLNPAYDTAASYYGGTWHMPTQAEIEELYNECTWEDSEEYFPVLGVRITGPNGNSIFLPQSGEKIGEEEVHEGFYGFFWSSTCDEMGDAFGEFRGLALSFSSKENKLINSQSRHIGRPIRPVKN